MMRPTCLRPDRARGQLPHARTGRAVRASLSDDLEFRGADDTPGARGFVEFGAESANFG